MQQESMPQQTVEVPLRLKDRLQITIKGTGEEVSTIYVSRVEQMAGSDFVIRWPTSRGTRAPLKENNLVCMFFIRGAEAFAVDARVLKLKPYPDPVIVVRCEGPLRKTQRRDFVRVPAMVPVRLFARLVMAKSTGDEGSSYLIMTTTVDISGGGFNIHHTAPLQMGSIYDVKMTIPTLEKPLALAAKVVRMESALNSKNETYYDIGFAFIKIDEPIRRQIVKYVFRFQQNNLVKQT